MRLLFDPAPTDGGGTSTPPPAPPVTPPPAVDPRDKELADLRTWKAQRDLEDRDKAETARKSTQQQLADKGKTEDLIKGHNTELAKRDEKYDTLMARTRTTELRRELTAALSGKPILPAAVNQLVALWSADFEVVDGPDGSFQVRCPKTFKTPDQIVAERLASKDFEHFVRADSRGGSGGSGSTPAGNPDPNSAPTEFKSYEDAVMHRWNTAQKAKAEGPSWQRDYRQNLTPKK